MAQSYAGIPPGPLSAYLGVRQANEQAGMQDVQAATQIQGLLARAQAQKLQEQFRAEMASAQTPDQQLAIAMKYGAPDDIIKSIGQEKLRKDLLASQQAATSEAQRIRGEQATGLETQRAADKENLARLAAQLRAPPIPRPEPAPSISEVVDPSDPNRLLKIDARLYRGGSLGSPGVIGIAGKEPGYAKRQEKEQQGVDHLKSELDNLRGYYKTLLDADAIPSSAKGSVSNVWAWTKGSTAGQLGGRILGTKEQDARNSIQSSRMRLLNAIKNATGMSAQQLNSNVELQTWLQSLTDVNRSYESNTDILDKIEKSFVKKPEDKGWKDL